MEIFLQNSQVWKNAEKSEKKLIREKFEYPYKPNWNNAQEEAIDQPGLCVSFTEESGLYNALDQISGRKSFTGRGGLKEISEGDNFQRVTET
ncbi:hypothetical protein CDAR_177081 [Caerostris darwini]|uniref:Uncharacterized protein n=1 Tax=Caerostris darwini TaxID=1538125 RepID=A0AAV4UBH1_9ARAC|nr:hypothetical protein CDAR_177081 [Caerostris darwini]